MPTTHSNLLKAEITKAKAGDTDSAKALITEFCATVNQNRQRNPDGTYKRNEDGSRIPHNKPSGEHTQFDEELLDYLVECFEKIGEIVGETGKQKRVTADVALNLSDFGKRGPKVSPKTRADSLVRGMRVWQVHQKEPSRPIEKICADMAGAELKSAHTLERDYKQFLSLLGSVDGI